MGKVVGSLKFLILTPMLALFLMPSEIEARDSVWVWYGDSSLSEINAPIGDTLFIDVFIKTDDSAYVGDMMLVLGFDMQYFDTLISEFSGSLNFPLTEWDLAYFYPPQGSPPNPSGWMSQAFQGFAELAPPYDSPLLHVEVPYKVMEMAAVTNSDPGLSGQTVNAIGPGLELVQGPSNAGDPYGQQGYEVVEYYSPVHFIGEVGFLEGSVENPDGEPIPGVSILISPGDTSIFSNDSGEYFIELLTGNYQATFSHPSYFDTTISVSIFLGQTTTADVQMTPLPSGYVSGFVSDTSTAPIPNILVHDSQDINEDATDIDGFYVLNLPQGAYVIEFNGIGYRDTSVSDIVVTVNETTYVDMIMNVDESEYDEIPETITIMQNYPNPFNTGTFIEFILEKPMRVDVEIFDILGRKVETVASLAGQQGLNTITWKPSDIASGIYYCRIRSKNNYESRAMLFIK